MDAHYTAVEIALRCRASDLIIEGYRARYDLHFVSPQRRLVYIYVMSELAKEEIRDMADAARVECGIQPLGPRGPHSMVGDTRFIGNEQRVVVLS
uniref:Uncharacterized protein n=1 Tax=viral metagenome TaxID=1070528 RepID=A0A6M3KGA1_9ZZZZ